jgi:hypothetical protein
VIRAALLGAGLVLALGGCGGDPEPAASPSPSASPSASAAPQLQGAVPALNHLRIDACPAGKGALEATGEVRNLGREAADYVVTVTWLDADGASLASATATLEQLPGKQSVPWSATADLAVPAVSCTTRVARGTLS